MKRLLLVLALLVPLPLVVLLARSAPEATGWTLVGWNNLGMHCMDKDFSVFSILPPYNVVCAQLIDPSGQLVTGGQGYTVTYQGVADPTGSINTTSAGKTNFWQYALQLFGAAPPPDMGLAGSGMPGASNTPQPMAYDPANAWFTAVGIPITPTDDALQHNPYPLMHLVARDSTGTVLAATDVVLPVSDEMDCSACHASGAGPAAEPSQGWVNDPDPQRDYRLNIVRLHDDRQQTSPEYTAALQAVGYLSSGLYDTAQGGQPILCAACHASAALSAPGVPGVPALTASVHYYHGHVADPSTGLTLDASTNRTACYRCHPGSATRCLRGAMGSAVAADGTMAMQCQDCHGTMTTVGDPARSGWLMEPACQQCHTGTATHNNGQIRYTSAFESPGVPRVPVDTTFATTPNAPAPGLSLYRFSTGHGGLECEACHGATHAEYPSSHANDNIETLQIQGHVGKLVECTACHGNQALSLSGGPHGMHTVGQSWAVGHGDLVEHSGSAACQACHGVDYSGTVLSYAQGDRTLSTSFGTKTFWRGYRVGCYSCHNGPGSESANPNRPAVAAGGTASTPQGQPAAIPLHATDPQGRALTLRIVSQAKNGTVGLSGTTATYYPEAGFTGTDSFTFAAWNGQLDSNLASVTVSVGAAVVPPSVSGIAGLSNPFRIKITGGNFQPGAQVTIGSDASPWPNTTVKSSSLIVLKGGASLKAKFAKGAAVTLTVTNPDGGTARASFTR